MCTVSIHWHQPSHIPKGLSLFRVKSRAHVHAACALVTTATGSLLYIPRTVPDPSVLNKSSNTIFPFKLFTKKHEKSYFRRCSHLESHILMSIQQHQPPECKQQRRWCHKGKQLIHIQLTYRSGTDRMTQASERPIENWHLWHIKQIWHNRSAGCFMWRTHAVFQLEECVCCQRFKWMRRVTEIRSQAGFWGVNGRSHWLMKAIKSFAKCVTLLWQGCPIWKTHNWDVRWR